MSNPYLILHKVRGEPVFDIAQQVPCALCRQGEDPMCIECNENGFWWIIPTSGHRAYPWYAIDIQDLADKFDPFLGLNAPDMPPNWPDHYPTKASKEPSIGAADLLQAIGLVPKIKRRF